MANPAEGYESYMVPTLFGPCATILIQEADPKRGERVLDVGCGTGIVAREVASRLGTTATVTAVDPSANMLAVARAVAAEEGLTIEWREGNAEQLPFHDDAFDLVLCQFALMFVADKAAALSEMRRVVNGSGRVLIGAWRGLDRPSFLSDPAQRHSTTSGNVSSPRNLRVGRCRRSARPGAGSRISIRGDKAVFIDGTFSKSRGIYCWGNRGRYRCDSFDAAPRF